MAPLPGILWRGAQHSHRNITLSAAWLGQTHTHTPGSSCPLPSEPAGSCCCCAALLLLPDPPSPPPAPSRCLLPVVAISLFSGGCVDTLQKPPTAPTPPQAVSPYRETPDHMIPPISRSWDVTVSLVCRWYAYQRHIHRRRYARALDHRQSSTRSGTRVESRRGADAAVEHYSTARCYL